MQWEKGSPAVTEDLSSTLFCCGLRKKLYQSKRVVRAARAAVHWSTLAQAAASSPGSHTIPRKAAHTTHCQPYFSQLLGRSHPPFLWVIQGQWPRNSFQVLKEGQMIQEYWWEKDMTKLLIPMSLGSTFCNSSPETYAPAATMTGGRSNAGSEPTLVWSEISLSEKWRKHVSKCWVCVSSMRPPQSNYGYIDYGSQVCFPGRHSDHSLDHIVFRQESS